MRTSNAPLLLWLKSLAWLILTGPLMALWNRPGWIGDVPQTPVYLFGLWLVLILVMRVWALATHKSRNDAPYVY
jgi:hypothetical protein